MAGGNIDPSKMGDMM